MIVQPVRQTIVAPSGVTGTQGVPGPAGSGTTIGVKDEGTLVSGVVERINIAGAGAFVSGTGADVTINIPGTSGMVLFSDLPSMTIPVGVDVIATSGYSVLDKGAAAYIYDAAVDSTYVTANPRTSFVSVNGRGFRLSETQAIDFDMFGADGTGATTSDSAWDAMQAWGALVNPLSGMPQVFFSGTHYAFATAKDLKLAVRLTGYGVGYRYGYTKLSWPASSAGFRVQRLNTVGVGGAGASTTGADGSIIEGFFFESGYAGTPTLLHSAIHLRARAHVQDCAFAGWSGLGILAYADVGGAGAAYGNANGWSARNIQILLCRYGGMFASGGDTNASGIENIDIASCGGFGLAGKAFLGGYFGNIQIDACGVDGAAALSQTAMVTDGTYRYRLIPGQDALAATTPPTSGVDNAVWAIESTGGVGSGIPLYSTYAGTFVSGGSAWLAGANAANLAAYLYAENNQPSPWIEATSIVIGGPAGQGQIGGGAVIGSTGHGAVNQNGWGKRYTNPATGKAVEFSIGRDDKRTILYFRHEDYDTGFWALNYGNAASPSADIWFTNSDGGHPVYKILGEGTTEQAGTGASQSFNFQFAKLLLGPFNNAGARFITCDSAAPTTGAHAQGEIVFNNGAAASGKVGWVCVTAGTPGTWKPFGAIDA